jgi:uncharacterized membrane protein YidH (DUF202 family)
MDYAIAIFWVACSVLCYGVSMAYWQRKFAIIAKSSYTSDLRFSTLISIGGPISLLLVFFMSDWGTYGLLYRNPHKDSQNV